MLDRLRSSLPAWRRALRRRRRVLAVLAATALLASVLPAMLPPSARGVPVLVATRDLDEGAVLTAQDTRLVLVAPALVPDGAIGATRDATGRPLDVPLTAGAVVLEGALRDADDHLDLQGRVSMVLPLDAALLPHVSRGTRLDIVLSTPDPAAARTVSAQVLDIPSAEQAPPLGTTGSPNVPVVIAVSPGDARHIAHTTRDGWATVTILH